MAVAPNKESRQARRLGALDLRLSGLPIRRIAERQGVSVSTSHNDLDKILGDLADQHTAGAAQLRELQLLRYESMLAPLWPLVIQLGIAEGQRTKGEDSVSHGVRWSVFKRDGYACVLCSKDSDLTIDHLLPQSKGGSDDEANLQTLCRSCNSGKGASGAAPSNVVRLNSLAFEQVMKILDRINRICGLIPDKSLIENLTVNEDNRRVNMFQTEVTPKQLEEYAQIIRQIAAVQDVPAEAEPQAAQPNGHKESFKI